MVTFQALGGFRVTQNQGRQSQPLHTQPVWLRDRPYCRACLPCCTDGFCQAKQFYMLLSLTHSLKHKLFQYAFSCSLHLLLSYYSTCVCVSCSHTRHRPHTVFLFMLKHCHFVTFLLLQLKHRCNSDCSKRDICPVRFSCFLCVFSCSAPPLQELFSFITMECKECVESV